MSPDVLARQPSLITTPLIVVSVIFPVISFTTVLLRHKARNTAKQAVKADEWWIFVAWVRLCQSWIM